MMNLFKKANFKIHVFSVILSLVSMSCAWHGIPLEKRKHLPLSPSNGCDSNIEIRTYRVLFLLPIFEHNLNKEKDTNPTDIFVVETNSFAKPWDIIFTTLGFLVSFNSSTDRLVVCPKKLVLEALQSQDNNPNIPSKLPFWYSNGNPNPIHSINFPPDDHTLTEESKETLISFTREVLKSEISFKIVLVGKSYTSGDIAYQSRLVKRRFDEIKQILTKESIDENRIQSLIADGKIRTSNPEKHADSHSTISIYLVKN
ncbi:OmpA family protein [Leptospira paudalimensis]|uniref:Cell envelope biogenesis protein OmpA n=1 Tax=Leptospira paudalimensis TaxID=2950024 RepID=A0ABT3M3P7_9LEPT|nr:cell envelope biogenesis protein OmpA [Leptospira paudalimensis]MCW7503006.1 cell envelope biogenesis protein OmpA [Leptospira paudalimensis]